MTYYVYHIYLDGMGLDEGYVGITRNPKARWKAHSKRKSYVGNVIRKHRDTLKYSIVACFNSEEDARWLEFALRPCKNIGWNIAVGGAKCPMDGIKNHSYETRLKMSKSHTGKKTPRDVVDKITVANRGKKRTQKQIAYMKTLNNGFDSPKAKAANIHLYSDDSLVASGVVIREWCKENNVPHSSLYKSLTSDTSLPSSKTNVRHSKGFYARYVDDKTYSG